MKWFIKNGWLIAKNPTRERRIRLDGVVTYTRHGAQIYIETERNTVHLDFETQEEAEILIAQLDSVFLTPTQSSVPSPQS